ncbi:hypothetical protein [Gracilinema caldarium]|uniref:Outer membrane protein beta-barrel domain-containing protein n=1 Tax=Gracilinema caldarium (strain ATCC 51460 / DSM 7334 / H1) TaxID=744872 RepID=F8F367_GRAC1|nr:hypothetical protein [Gracilinema caldarium]AEJ20393.1 hypothetical protein Spica_2281 [Gracilinema caldarium DSM 7334]
MKGTTNTQRALVYFTILALCITSQIFANPETVQNYCTGNVSLGFSVQEWEDDLGMGLGLTSPWFLYEKAAIRVSGNVLFKTDNQWKPYYAIRTGLIGGSFMQSADIRLYGEGGFLFLFPDTSFDSASFRLGGYGHFGFEFFLSTTPGSGSYFIEVGSNAIDAKSLAGNHYLNGFATTCGFRFYP